jgi:hypothetical protein
MLKKIWQSFMRWVRKTFGKGAAKTLDRRAAIAELPPLDDPDREYLFMQLLEGVAHGWQQPRAVGFFNKIKQRVRKSEWLEWLDRFGTNLLNAPVPNYELAGRMVQLSQLDCGEICDLAGEYGIKLLERQAAENSAGMLPIIEFSGVDDENPFGTSYGGAIEGNNIDWDEIPPELLGDINSPSDLRSPQPEEQEYSQTREITLEEFAAMLHKDPNLVAELAEQFGIETTDPQIIINAVIAQMQQQVQPISGELNNTSTPHEISVVPPSPEPPHIEHRPNSGKPATTNAMPAPPPPPKPKLVEYKSEDPWASVAHNSEEAHPETVNSPDRT